MWQWLRGGSALLGLMLPAAVLAQATDPAAQVAATPSFWASLDPLTWLLILSAGVLAVIVMLLLTAVLLLVNYVVKQQIGYSPIERFIASLPTPTFLSWSRMMALRPAKGKEASYDQDLGHDYDGITELDNGAPPIFNYIFYGTIGFAAIYLFAFWGLNTSSLRMHWEYDQEMKIAAAEKAERAKNAANAVDETNVVLLTDASALEDGKKVYLLSCQACHGAQGQGGVGPNLTDDYWLHGGSIKDIFKTVKYGVPDKGMVSWQAQLSPSQMAAVSSYIHTMHGTNPPNAKAPQGEKYVAAEAEAPAPVDTSKTIVTQR